MSDAEGTPHRHLRFSPGDLVSREQMATVRRDSMATFLARMLQAYVVDGAPVPSR